MKEYVEQNNLLSQPRRMLFAFLQLQTEQLLDHFLNFI